MSDLSLYYPIVAIFVHSWDRDGVCLPNDIHIQPNDRCSDLYLFRDNSDESGSYCMTELQKYDTQVELFQPRDIRSNNFSTQRRISLFLLKSIGLMLLDTLMVFGSWTLAARLHPGTNLTGAIGPILTISIVTLHASGFYGTDDKLHRFSKLFQSLTLAQIVILVTAFFDRPGLWRSPAVLAIAGLLNFLSIGGARYLVDLVMLSIRKHNPSLQPSVILMGQRAEVDRVRNFLSRSGQFRVDSSIDLAAWDMQTQLDRILDLIYARKVSEVFICSQQAIDNQIVLFWNLKAAGIHLRIVPTELQLPQRSAETKMINELPTVRFKSLPIFGMSFWIKRCLDTIAALVILLISSPILAAIATAIVTTSPGPIFYKQERVGLKGHRFEIWKFRTMVNNANELQQELEDRNEVQGGVLFKIKADPRITKVGKFLRQYSLDELPQLINVLRGQMSLVGPRPLTLRDYHMSLQDGDRLSQDRLLRYEVLPGITGLWQVKGRTSISSEEIFYWDTVYILQWSLSLDLRILVETIKVVLFKEGSY